MVKRVGMAIVMAGVWLIGASDARAQSARDALRNLFENGNGRGALSANSIEALYGLVLAETTTFPIGSSAGGFSWSFVSRSIH